MPRYALKIEYNGMPFHGWQAQDDVPAVQSRIESALRDMTGAATRVQGAGRTDTGVHALGQVAHLDLTGDWDPFRISEGLNHFLGRSGVAILDAARVSDDFHARFHAVERGYLYRMMERRAPLTHLAQQVWRTKVTLDIDAMQAAANCLLGQHDFTTFRSTMCQADSPIRTLDIARVKRVEREIHFTFRARSFLHNQIRSFVGSLFDVGRGRWTADDVAAALAAKDRKACGQVAPPDGLYLTDVTYPEDPFGGN